MIIMKSDATKEQILTNQITYKRRRGNRNGRGKARDVPFSRRNSSALYLWALSAMSGKYRLTQRALAC